MISLAALKKKAAVSDGSFPTSANATGAQSVSSYLDTFNKRRMPQDKDLLRELKNTSYACVCLNANTGAMFPPEAYIKTSPGLPIPKCIPREDLFDISPLVKKSLEKYPYWKMKTKASRDQFALPAHPIHNLFVRQNKFHSGFNFWSLTDQYRWVFGIAYWQVVIDPWTGVPMELRILPTHMVEPKYESSPNLDSDPYYQQAPSYYKVTFNVNHRFAHQELPPEQVIAMPVADLSNPFRGGRGAHQAGYEFTLLQSEYIAHRLALWENHARPDFIVSPAGPDGYIGTEEMKRTESLWNQLHRRGGVGKPYFSQSPLRVDVLSFMESQVQMLSEHGVTKEDILNMWGVPVSFYTRETNMANLSASTELYTRNTIRPNLYGRDQVITEKLCPLYDPSGQLFVSSEDPVPEDEAAKWNEIKVRLETGLSSINDIKSTMLNEPPVIWGNEPIMPTHFAPLDINLIQELRERLRYGDNDAAGILHSMRTRTRLEDMNPEDRPMSEYSQAKPHDGLTPGKKKEAVKKKSEAEIVEKAFIDPPNQTFHTHVPAIEFPPFPAQPEIKFPPFPEPPNFAPLVDAVERLADRPIEPRIDAKPDMSAFAASMAALAKSVGELVNRPVDARVVMPTPPARGKQKAKWTDSEGKVQEIEIIRE